MRSSIVSSHHRLLFIKPVIQLRHVVMALAAEVAVARTGMVETAAVKTAEHGRHLIRVPPPFPQRLGAQSPG